VVACARKLAGLFWCLLTRGEDYAHQQRSLTAEAALLEIRAGAKMLERTNTACSPPAIAPSGSSRGQKTGSTRFLVGSRASPGRSVRLHCPQRIGAPDRLYFDLTVASVDKESGDAQASYRA
jgi:hypothetical protein